MTPVKFSRLYANVAFRTVDDYNAPVWLSVCDDPRLLEGPCGIQLTTGQIKEFSPDAVVYVLPQCTIPLFVNDATDELYSDE